MALTSTDLLTPNGEIDGALFYPSVPSLDVASRITVFLAQGYANATDAGVTDDTIADKVARFFAYYRAWSDVVNRLTIAPASTSLAAEVSSTYLQTQIDQWIARRDAWLAQYEQLVPSAAPAVPTNPVSRVIPTQICF